MDDVTKKELREFIREEVEQFAATTAEARYASRIADKALDIAMEAKVKVDAMEKSTHQVSFFSPDDFKDPETGEGVDQDGNPVMLKDMLEMGGARRPEMHDLDGYEGEDFREPVGEQKDG